ncbi:MAG: zinc-ribbon domain-containing protein [Polyangiaceae bacterium]|jgi:predicted Zn finger-like uncharacterized protein
MKITCQACQARYTIADDKIVGKVVKIRCKKCGASIVVNGSEPPGAPSAVAASLSGTSSAGEAWTVNVADGDQRTMTVADVAAAYASKLIDDETLCWKEGMPDWLALREIGPLRDECVRAAANPGAANARPEGSQEDELPTRIFDPAKEGPVSGPVGGPVDLADPKAPTPAHALANGAQAAASSVAAARRTGGRGPSADLFKGAAQAGGEDDVMTSAPPEGAQAVHPEGQKLIGARNESSVLFSLGALTGPSAAGAQGAVGEASGLFDIRQLGAKAPPQSDQKKKSRVDDIMNLGSGSLNAAMAAPVLAVPSLDKYTAPTGLAAVAAAAVSAQVRNRVLIVLGVCASLFFVVAAVGTAMWVMRGLAANPDEKLKTAAGSAVADASPEQGPVAANAPAEPSPSAAPPSTEPSTEAPTAKEGAKEGKDKEPAKARAANPASAGAGETAGAAAPKTAAAPARETAPAAAPAVVSDQPFNMGEARARLGAIADNVQSCRKGSTTGTGRVVITFNPSGSAASAVLSPGSPFDGTPTGACVAARFRSARVPAFAGSPFPVSKSFTIN